MWRLIAVVLAGICLQFGCATPPPRTILPPGPMLSWTDAEDAIQALRERYGSLESLKAGGTIETRFPPENKRKRASFVLMLKKPDKLRIRTYRPLVPLLLELVYDGKKCWLFVPGRNTAYLSDDCGMLYFDNSDIPLPANALIAAVVVVPDFDALLSAPAQLHRENGFAVLAFTEESGTRRELWIASETGFVERQLILDNNGGRAAVIEYREQDSSGNVIVPRSVEVTLPQADTSISLFMDDIKPNAQIPDEAFEFSPSANISVLQVGEGVHGFFGLSGE